MGESIISYINDHQELGETCVLWFDDQTDRISFLNDIKQQALKHSDNDLIPTNDACVDFVKIPSLVNGKESNSPWIYIVSNVKSLEWICQWVLSLHGIESASIYIIDEHISTTFFADKVICVGKKGVVKDAFYLLN